MLLAQTSIPCSMLFSRYLLGERYHWKQYIGAAVVLAGISVVLEPVITHRHSPDFYCEASNPEENCLACQGEVTEESCVARAPDQLWWLRDANTSLVDDEGSDVCRWLPFEDAVREKEVLAFIWSFVMIASSIPMTLSAIYKQVAIADGVALDPIFLNGSTAIYQFLFGLLVTFPGGLLASPRVQPWEMPKNLWDGLKCYLGQGSIDTGCHPDSMCTFHAALFVNLCLLSNFFYTLFMVLVLKYGTSALLFLALTLIVPIGNLAFTLPFIPESTPLHVSDIIALVVIILGLLLYRFEDRQHRGEDEDEMLPQEADDSCAERSKAWPQSDLEVLRHPLLSGDV